MALKCSWAPRISLPASILTLTLASLPQAEIVPHPWRSTITQSTLYILFSYISLRDNISYFPIYQPHSRHNFSGLGRDGEAHESLPSYLLITCVISLEKYSICCRSGCKPSQVTAQTVAGLQKIDELRRYFACSPDPRRR